jgi:hypothetical protein
MDRFDQTTIARRHFLAGAAAGGILLVPGCSSLGGFSMVEAIKRLLTKSSQNAFGKLTLPGGFWDSAVARFDVPELFSGSGGSIKSLLTSALFKDKLQRQLNVLAEKGAERAAPVVLDTVGKISIPDAVGLVRGGPTAATSWLRGQMGTGLVNAMVPGLGDALKLAGDPVISQAIGALAGVDLGQVAQAVASKADNSIWNQIGAEESAIRANPEATNDPLLIGVFKVL